MKANNIIHGDVSLAGILSSAEKIYYDNASSGLNTENVQGAINELDSSVRELFIRPAGGEAWNGLTKTDNSIGLGGGLQNDVTIDLSIHTFQLSYDGGYTYTIVENGDIDLFSSGGPENGQWAEVEIGGSDPGRLYLNFTSKGIVEDSSVTPAGLQYDADYSNTFLENSLPSVKWVHATIDACGGFPYYKTLTDFLVWKMKPSTYLQIGDADENFGLGIGYWPSASNGQTNTSIKGGYVLPYMQRSVVSTTAYEVALTHSTSTGDYQMNFAQNGLRYNADYSSKYTDRTLPDVAWVHATIDACAMGSSSLLPLEASIVRIDASLNDTIDLYSVINASLNELYNMGTSLINYGASTGTINIDMSQDRRAKLTLTGTTTLNLINLSDTYSRTVVLDISAGSADRTLNWDASLSANQWVDGEILTLIDSSTYGFTVSINTNGQSKYDTLISWVKRGL